MRQSEMQFIRQMGITTIEPDHGLYVALMFQPRAIGVIVAVGIVLQSAWVFLALAALVWWGTIVPTRNVFDAAYNRLIAFPPGLPPIPTSLAPRRFAQAVAGTVSLAVAAALVSGATSTAWVLEGLFAMGTTMVVVGRVCGPAVLYLRLTGLMGAAPGRPRRA